MEIGTILQKGDKRLPPAVVVIHHEGETITGTNVRMPSSDWRWYGPEEDEAVAAILARDDLWVTLIVGACPAIEGRIVAIKNGRCV